MYYDAFEASISILRYYLRPGLGMWNTFIWKTVVFRRQLYFVFCISNTKIDNQSYYLNYKIQKIYKNI